MKNMILKIIIIGIILLLICTSFSQSVISISLSADNTKNIEFKSSVSSSTIDTTNRLENELINNSTIISSSCNQLKDINQYREYIENQFNEKGQIKQNTINEEKQYQPIQGLLDGSEVTCNDVQKPQYVPGEMLVKFSPEVIIDKEQSLQTNIPSINTLNNRFQVNSMERVFKNYHDDVDNNYGFDQVYRLTFSDEIDVLEIVNEYEIDPFVIYAQLNYLYYTCEVPNDPYYHSYGSWGQNFNDLYGMHNIETEGAWNVTTGSEEVIVAVIDTGIDYDHNDLVDNMWSDQYGHHGYDFINNDNDPIDDHGHGTHCAGTIAAVGNNELGVVGVNWNLKLMAIKSISGGGSGSSNGFADGIMWAADHGADILSNSWGPSAPHPNDPTVENAVRYAYEAGCVIVFAAGNLNDDVRNYCPANMPETITVAATDHQDKKAEFSNWGELVDVSAPGVDVLSTFPSYISRDIYPGKIIVNENPEDSISAYTMEYSPLPPSEGINEELLYAGLGYPDDFQGQNFIDKVALIQRGGLLFKYKVENAAAAGAIAAIIYNNEPGMFYGTLQELGEIPAFSIAQEDGIYLHDLLIEQEVMVNISVFDVENYTVFSGTSMSCPHVAGLAALYLSKNQSMTNEMIHTIIVNTADEIYSPKYIGKGRINADETLHRTPALVKINATIENTEVNGVIEITGSAWGEQFEYCTLEVGRGIDPYNWIELCNSSTPIIDDIIGQIDFSTMKNGMHTIRMKVICTDGMYEDQIKIYHRNHLVVSNDYFAGHADYNNIQEAIDNAENDTKIYVVDGIYYENLIINKTIHLFGLNKNTTIIHGIGENAVINIITDNVTIAGFTITNGTTGVFLQLSQNVKLYNNMIKENLVGINISNNSNLNHCFHNLFIDNDLHAYDSGVNKWDDGYPSGGNYWDDHQSFIDDYSGPNQDINGSDGIVDTPYYIEGGSSKDNYPFMSLYFTIFEPDEVYVKINNNITTPGWGVDHFDSIWDAIYSVQNNGTVFVHSDEYFEKCILVYKSVSLIGDNKENTIIDGGGFKSVLYCTADNIRISGFTIQNSGCYDWLTHAGIGLRSNLNVISHNILKNNEFGIKSWNSESNNINNNTLFSNKRDGIEFDKRSHYNTISYNKIYNNDGSGISHIEGFFPDPDYFLVINNNVVCDNEEFGIRLESIYNSSVFKNIIFNNKNDGISLNSCVNNTIKENMIVNNEDGIFISSSSNDNRIHHNNLYFNEDNADDCEESNQWDNGYPSGGNYWNDYSGEDIFSGPDQNISGSDGIGDTPYHVGYYGYIDAEDRYPLMNYVPYEIVTSTNGPYHGVNDCQIHFQGIVWGGISPYNWYWDFGDGNTSNQQNPTHSYEQPGTYVVNLTVTDSQNTIGLDSTIAIVEVGELIADAHGPYIGFVDYTMDFSGSAIGGIKPYNWSWDFGDGNMSYLQNPVYSYSQPGTYYVNLTVTDSQNTIDLDSTTAIVEIGELIADAHGPYIGFVNDLISFTGSAIGGIKPYNWSWDFGDSNISYLQNPSKTYDQEGVYAATLTVTDDQGNISRDIATIVIISSQWILVDDDFDANTPGWGEYCFNNIQDGINASTEQDIVFVFNGVYTEHIIINKSITFMGEDSNNTIIDGLNKGGGGGGSVTGIVTIVAENVTFSQFQISNGNYGMNLTNAPNCTIKSNIFSNIDYSAIWVSTGSNYSNITNNKIINTMQQGGGIVLTESSNHNINNNYIVGNLAGMQIYLSSNNTITENFISNEFFGIELLRSSSNTITDNIFEKSGIIFFPEGYPDDPLIFWNSHIIKNNTINGRAILYYKNINDQIVPSNCGQVILANCTGCTIQNLNISDIEVGVQLGYSSNNTIINNKISNNSYFGILLAYSKNNIIINNIIEKINWAYGLFLIYSRDNTISQNNISRCIYGIHSVYSDTNDFTKNYLEENTDGIVFYESNDNVLIENTIYNNSGFGVNFWNSDANYLYHNNFINNTHHAYDDASNNWYEENIEEGNYWDDFEQNSGYPDYYIIPGADNIDMFPLAEPYQQLLGDINYDGKVNIDDLFLVLAAWGQTGEPGWIPEDLNWDGKVDIDDLFIVLTNWT